MGFNGVTQAHPMATTSPSPNHMGSRRVRWRRHRYPDRVINGRQEMAIALLFGLLGLVATAIVFLSADTLMCAFGEWTLECSERTPPAEE